MPKTIHHAGFKLEKESGGGYKLEVHLLPEGMTHEEFVARVIFAVNSGFYSDQLKEA